MNLVASDNAVNLYEGKVYSNSGNAPLLELISGAPGRVLDVGCGAGDNAAILKSRGGQVWGVTLSESEAEVARQHCESVVVGNVETSELGLPHDFFDTLILSHVIEHLVRPDLALCRMAAYLRDGGRAFVAVPNMAAYSLRLRMLRGDWRRDDHGPFDRTHYHFWNYHTIDEVFRGTPFCVLKKTCTSSVPLWLLRRVLPSRLLRPVDELGGRVLPNLFAGQTLVVVEKR